MSKDHWDAILASAPLNATAGKVAGKGVDFVPEKLFRQSHWEVCPVMRRPSARSLADPNFVDLVGREFGRLTVIGYIGKFDPNSKNGRALWVCRCKCGRYQGQTSAYIKSAPSDAKCQWCDYTASLREAVAGDGARHRAESPEAQKWKPAA